MYQFDLICVICVQFHVIVRIWCCNCKSDSNHGTYLLCGQSTSNLLPANQLTISTKYLPTIVKMAKTLASNSKFMDARSKIKARVSQYFSKRSSKDDESDTELVDINSQMLLPLEIWLYYILPKMAVKDVQRLRGVCKLWLEMIRVYWNNKGKPNTRSKTSTIDCQWSFDWFQFQIRFVKGFSFLEVSPLMQNLWKPHLPKVLKPWTLILWLNFHLCQT